VFCFYGKNWLKKTLSDHLYTALGIRSHRYQHHLQFFTSYNKFNKKDKKQEFNDSSILHILIEIQNRGLMRNTSFLISSRSDLWGKLSVSHRVLIAYIFKIMIDYVKEKFYILLSTSSNQIVEKKPSKWEILPYWKELVLQIVWIRYFFKTFNFLNKTI